MASKKLRLLASAITMLPLLALASAPLMDSMDYDGSTSEAWVMNKLFVDLPPSDSLRKLQGDERCSALGGPRAKWRVENGRLWLVGLFGCSGNIPLTQVFEGNQGPIFAEWVTGQIRTHKGKQLCREPNRGIGLFELTVILGFEHGMLVHVEEVSNANHPAVATVEDLRKIFRASAHLNEAEVDSLAREYVSESKWECLSPDLQKKLLDLPPGGTAR